MRVLLEINQQRGYRAATSHWGALLFGYFLLSTQEKVTRH